jgi:hypothetical protein
MKAQSMLFVLLLCLGASVGLGAPATLVDGKSKVASSEAQIASCVRVWQHRLRLDDWKIETRIVRANELKPDTLGNLKWNSISRTAIIKVLSPLDYDIPVADIPEDMEYTVVHELVHLQLSALPRDLNRRDVEEQVVNKISDALMTLEKGDGFRARSQPVTPSKAGPGNETNASPEVVGRQAKRPVPPPPAQ